MRAPLLLLIGVPLLLVAQTQPGAFVSVSGASYATPVAPGSIVSGFGANFSSSIASASPLDPTSTLGGVTVDVIDSSTTHRTALLYYVSPGQINYIMPDSVAPGTAAVEVRSNGVLVATGTVEIASVARGLFTANGRGSGVPAGRAILVAPNGAATIQPLVTCLAGLCFSRAILWPPTSALYLELYGTGFRARTSLAAVAATIEEKALDVLYAGPQSQYPGLDQLNLRLPSSIAGGLHEIQITVDGRPANTVNILIAGGAAPVPVTVRFDPTTPEFGPFPTDFLTVADPSQKTGRRIDLPAPNCASRPTDCETYSSLNQLDGFNLQPRLRVRFSGAVDLTTLGDGVGLVWLNNLTNEETGLRPQGYFSRNSRGIFDSATNTFYAESNDPLDQHRRYALVITDAVRDQFGNPVQPDPAYLACVQGMQSPYCRDLAAALPAITAAAGRPVVAVSIFTTLSATSWLEKARAVVQSTPPNVTRTAAVELSKFASATLRLQTGVKPVRLEDFNVPLPGVIATGTDLVFFASYESPTFLDDKQLIASLPTGPAPPVSRGTSRISFHVFLPKSAKPAAGYPVVIFGHGLSDSAFGAPTLVAGTLVRQGIAVAVINAVGHGSGPLTNLVLTDFTGSATTIPVPGRGVDLDGNGEIGSREGCLLATAGVALRDCLRQTAVDLMQLDRIIRTGLDLNGDTVRDLDPGRIYFAGQSLGSLYGTLFTAVEPDVRAAALNVGGGTVVDAAVLSDNFHSTARDILAQHVPSLLNLPNDFNANFALRDQPVRVNNVAGAIEIQNYLDLLEWLQMPGDPIGFAAHLKLTPLPGVPAKRVLFQIARGDRTVPNPSSSNLIRQAGGLDSTILYRHDIARSVSIGLDENPHGFLVDIRSLPGLTIAGAAQQQIAGYLNADGNAIPDVSSTAVEIVFLGRRIFERPTALPEDPGFTLP